jgi:hypothetical protein
MPDPSFPIPAGLDVPELAEGETIDFMTTYAVSEGMLIPLSVENNPITESEEAEQEAPEEEADFGSAVEKRMGGMS